MSFELLLVIISMIEAPIFLFITWIEVSRKGSLVNDSEC